MKNIKIKYLGSLIVALFFLSSCYKEYDNIFNMFDDVTVTFHSTTPNSVTDFKEVEVGDDVDLDFTITSAKKSMYMVCIWEAGGAIPFRKIPLDASQRKSFSHVETIAMTNKVGTISYRVWALDSAGVYIGDGKKLITVHVKPDYNYWAGRAIYVPDTVEKVNKSYLSLSTGELFNYTEGVTNSDKIDLGFAFNGTPTIYALTASPLPFTPYDISAWTKKATLFAAIKSNQGSTWLNQLRTGAALEKNAKSAKTTLKSVNNLKAGSLVYFLTAEGKYGGLYVNYITQNSATKGTFMNVDIKIQK